MEKIIIIILCIAVLHSLMTRLFKIGEKEWIAPRKIADFLITKFMDLVAIEISRYYG